MAQCEGGSAVLSMPFDMNPHPIGSFFVRLGLAGRATVRAALAVQRREGRGRRLGTILLASGLIDEADLARALRMQRDARYRQRNHRVRKVFPHRAGSQAGRGLGRPARGQRLAVMRRSGTRK